MCFSDFFYTFFKVYYTAIREKENQSPNTLVSSVLIPLCPHDGGGPTGQYLEGSEHCQGVIICESMHEGGPSPVSQGEELVPMGLQNHHTQIQHIQDLKGKRARLQKIGKA